MSGSIALSEAPQKLLDQNKWAEVRAFAPNDLIALTYLNAPYPDLDAPSDFFWGGDGSSDQAVRCYENGRNLLGQSRRLLIEGKLVATGSRPDGTRVKIKPIEWANLWPMFATNRATGPNGSYDDVEIVERRRWKRRTQRYSAIVLTGFPSKTLRLLSRRRLPSVIRQNWKLE